MKAAVPFFCQLQKSILETLPGHRRQTNSSRCLSRCQEFRRTYIHTGRQSWSDFQKGEYLSFGAILVAEGGIQGPQVQATF